MQAFLPFIGRDWIICSELCVKSASFPIQAILEVCAIPCPPPWRMASLPLPRQRVQQSLYGKNNEFQAVQPHGEKRKKFPRLFNVLADSVSFHNCEWKVLPSCVTVWVLSSASIFFREFGNSIIQIRIQFFDRNLTIFRAAICVSVKALKKSISENTVTKF